MRKKKTRKGKKRLQKNIQAKNYFYLRRPWTKKEMFTFDWTKKNNFI